MPVDTHEEITRKVIEKIKTEEWSIARTIVEKSCKRNCSELAYRIGRVMLAMPDKEAAEKFLSMFKSRRVM